VLKAGVLTAQPFGSGRLFRAVRGRTVPDWAKDFASSWAQFFLIRACTGDFSAQISCQRSATGRTDKMRGGLHALSHRRCCIFSRNWSRTEPRHIVRAAPFMIVGNDEKVLWDDQGKPIMSLLGKDSVLILDLADP
jgi:hypothetical protein